MTRHISPLAGKTVFLSGQGTRGDIHPLLGIAREVHRRGGIPVLVLNEYYQGLVEKAGFAFRSTGSSQDHLEFVRDPRTWDPRADVGTLSWESIARPAIEKGFRHVREWIENTQEVPIVVGIQPSVNGTLWAAERYDLPAFHTLLAPNILISESDPPAPAKWLIPAWLPRERRIEKVRKLIKSENERNFRKPFVAELQALRRRYGLDEFGGISIDSTLSHHFTHAALFPQWYAPPAPDWPDDLEFLGFPLFDGDGASLPADVENFITAYGAPVVSTFGTGFEGTDALIANLLEAQGLLDLPFLFVGGNKAAIPNDSTGKIMHADYVDFATLFPRSRVVIHHGGIGTAAQAMKAATPQLIRPMAYDQYDNADRVKTLDVGDFLLDKDFTPQRIANKVTALALSKTVRQSLDQASIRLKGTKAIENLCNLIEEHLEVGDATQQAAASV